MKQHFRSDDANRREFEDANSRQCERILFIIAQVLGDCRRGKVLKIVHLLNVIPVFFPGAYYLLVAISVPFISVN